jgi:hypothetical protein
MLGTSSTLFNESIVRAIRAIGPKTILDVGAGSGKIAKLAHRANPAIRLTALQKSFQTYDIAALYSAGYTTVIDEDISEYLKFGFDETFDLVTVCDVIEHFLFGDAIGYLKFLAYRSSFLLVVWPEAHPQTLMNHPFDRHRCSFSARELFNHFEFVRYEQTGFAQMSAVHVYHFAILRGVGNLTTFPIY